MNPPSPVRLTTGAVNISMQATDHFFFQFDVDGVFESPHAKGFKPHLPHDRSFKAGSMWPNPKEHPEGVRPSGNEPMITPGHLMRANRSLPPKT